MAEITYQALVDKLQAQSKKFDEWRPALINEAYVIRSDIVSILGCPEEWVTHDKAERRKYVDVINLSNSNGGFAGILSYNSITDQGELVFGISFTLDLGPKIHPKWISYIPVAVRYKDYIPEYCQWDTHSEAPRTGSSWQRSKKLFIEEILNALNRYLSMDPFQGIPVKSTIGFINAG